MKMIGNIAYANTDTPMPQNDCETEFRGQVRSHLEIGKESLGSFSAFASVFQPHPARHRGSTPGRGFDF